MNYLGDLVIALAWALPCGLLYGIYPYSHLLFMIGLLLHRFARDDEACAKKYGADWDEYCRQVPYKLIPGVF
jgi:delta14-sterol reductase